MSNKTEQLDVVMCRHILWALPNPDEVLERWRKMLKEAGRLILIEGYWMTGDSSFQLRHNLNIWKILQR